jgi:hypothetical protein
VKLTDPDGRFIGFKQRVEDFISKLQEFIRKDRNGGISFEEKVKILENVDNKFLESIVNTAKVMAREFELKNTSEVEEYAQGELKRFIAFKKIRGQGIKGYSDAMEAFLESRDKYIRAQNDPEVQEKSLAIRKRFAENEANEIIDNLIKRYDENYQPPKPLRIDE